MGRKGEGGRGREREKKIKEAVVTDRDAGACHNW